MTPRLLAPIIDRVLAAVAEAGGNLPILARAALVDQLIAEVQAIENDAAKEIAERDATASKARAMNQRGAEGADFDGLDDEARGRWLHREGGP